MSMEPKELPLSPYRVLDLTDEKGFFCGRILGDLGADVIKIENPGGEPSRNIGPFYKDIPDPEKSLYWFAYNANKRGITLNIETAEGKELFKRMIKTTDFVIESFPPGYMHNLGLGYSTLSRINPGIIMTSISHFGQTGPYSHYKGSDLIDMAMGGYTYVCGDHDRPPVRITFPQAYLNGGLDAASGSMLAFHHRQLTGEGQWVDVSIQQSLTRYPYNVRLNWDFNRQIITRQGSMVMLLGASPVRNRRIWECKDGFVSFVLMGGPVYSPSNRSLVQWLDDEGLADDYLRNVDWDALDYSTITQESLDPVTERFSRFFMTHTATELYEGAKQRRIMIYPLSTPRDIADNPQLASREFWEEVEHPELNTTVTYPGAFVKSTETPFKIRRRAPLIGEHNDEVYKELETSRNEPLIQEKTASSDIGSNHRTKRALEGLKVIDFGWALAGPMVGLYLAHHGATVIRIESVKRPDVSRTSLPHKDNIPGINRTGVYASFNSNKLSMGLNLRHPEGVEIAKRLIAWGDIVGENFAPGVMERLGLDYKELKKIKPDVIMYSSSNLGQTGPEATQPGFGMQLSAYAGFANLLGWPDRAPAQPYGAYTDFPAPRFLVAAILATVEYHRRTGKGQYLDISQMEASVHLLTPVIMDYTVNQRILNRDGNRCPHAAPHGAYPCQGNDRWCTIAVFTDEEWNALCKVMGNPAWAKEVKFATHSGRKENEDELDIKLGEWTRNITAETVMETLQAAGVPAGVVKNGANIQDDPQLAHRHFFQELEHPEIGMHYYEGTTGCNLLKTPAEISMPGPLLGQHTEYVCREILDMSDEKFVDLLNRGVLE